MKTSENRRTDEKECVVTGGAVAEKEVLQYLQGHPEFFVQHQEVLAEIRIPHACGKAVSLLEYQVQTLRERAHDLRRKLQDLIQNARLNEALSERMHRLTLELMECAGADEVFATLYQALLHEFSVDAATVRLFRAPRLDSDGALNEFAHLDADARPLFLDVLEARRLVCGRLKGGQMQYLFAQQAAELHSGALVPLGKSEPFGILALASRDPKRFHAGMGTVFLRHLGDIAGRVVTPHLIEG